MPTRPARRPSRKRRLQSASEPSICDRRPALAGQRFATDAAPTITTALGPAGDHLPDRSLAMGSPRADRRERGGVDPAARVQAMACRTSRFAVARDDADRLHRTGDPAVSAEADRAVAVDPRTLG